MAVVVVVVGCNCIVRTQQQQQRRSFLSQDIPPSSFFPVPQVYNKISLSHPIHLRFPSYPKEDVTKSPVTVFLLSSYILWRKEKKEVYILPVFIFILNAAPKCFRLSTNPSSKDDPLEKRNCNFIRLWRTQERRVRDAIGGGNSFIAADDIGGSQNVQAATETFRWPSSTLQVPQGIVWKRKVHYITNNLLMNLSKLRNGKMERELTKGQKKLYFYRTWKLFSSDGKIGRKVKKKK